MNKEDLEKLGLTEEHLKQSKEGVHYLRIAYKFYEDACKEFDRPPPDYESFKSGFIIGADYMFKKCGGDGIIVATEDGKIIGNTIKNESH